MLEPQHHPKFGSSDSTGPAPQLKGVVDTPVADHPLSAHLLRATTITPTVQNKDSALQQAVTSGLRKDRPAVVDTSAFDKGSSGSATARAAKATLQVTSATSSSQQWHLRRHRKEGRLRVSLRAITQIPFSASVFFSPAGRREACSSNPRRRPRRRRRRRPRSSHRPSG